MGESESEYEIDDMSDKEPDFYYKIPSYVEPAFIKDYTLGLINSLKAINERIALLSLDVIDGEVRINFKPVSTSPPFLAKKDDLESSISNVSSDASFASAVLPPASPKRFNCPWNILTISAPYAFRKGKALFEIGVLETTTNDIDPVAVLTEHLATVDPSNYLRKILEMEDAKIVSLSVPPGQNTQSKSRSENQDCMHSLSTSESKESVATMKGTETDYDGPAFALFD